MTYKKNTKISHGHFRPTSKKFKILFSSYFLCFFKIVYKLFFLDEPKPKIGATIVHQHHTKSLDQLHVKNLTKTF
jgi:hypothetical protein